MKLTKGKHMYPMSNLESAAPAPISVYIAPQQPEPQKDTSEQTSLGFNEKVWNGNKFFCTMTRAGQGLKTCMFYLDEDPRRIYRILNGDGDDRFTINVGPDAMAVWNTLEKAEDPKVIEQRLVSLNKTKEVAAKIDNLLTNKNILIVYEPRTLINNDTKREHYELNLTTFETAKEVEPHEIQGVLSVLMTRGVPPSSIHHGKILLTKK